MSSFTKYSTEECSIFKYRQTTTGDDTYPDGLNKHGTRFPELYQAMASWNQDQQVSKFGANGKTDTGGSNLFTGNDIIKRMDYKERIGWLCFFDYYMTQGAIGQDSNKRYDFREMSLMCEWFLGQIGFERSSFVGALINEVVFKKGITRDAVPEPANNAVGGAKNYGDYYGNIPPAAQAELRKSVEQLFIGGTTSGDANKRLDEATSLVKEYSKGANLIGGATYTEQDAPVDRGSLGSTGIGQTGALGKTEVFADSFNCAFLALMCQCALAQFGARQSETDPVGAAVKFDGDKWVYPSKSMVKATRDNGKVDQAQAIAGILFAIDGAAANVIRRDFDADGRPPGMSHQVQDPYLSEYKNGIKGKDNLGVATFIKQTLEKMGGPLNNRGAAHGSRAKYKVFLADELDRIEKKSGGKGVSQGLGVRPAGAFATGYMFGSDKVNQAPVTSGTSDSSGLKVANLNAHPYVNAEFMLRMMLPEYIQKTGGNEKDNIKKAIEATNRNITPIADKLNPRNRNKREAAKARRERLNDNIYQCILLAAMEELQEFSVSLRTFKNRAGKSIKSSFAGGKWDAPAINPPWGGRIIPVRIDPEQALVNAMTLPPVNRSKVSINKWINAPQITVNRAVTKMEIFKVVKNFREYTGKKDKKGKKIQGKLINNGDEVELPLMFSSGIQVEDDNGKNIYVDTAVPLSLRKKLKGKRIQKSNLVILKDIDINFKGGNMATAKSDVTVTMTFKLPNIQYIEQKFTATRSITDSKGKIQTFDYFYEFVDLITYTRNNSPTGFASMFRNQHHPDYNRLLLKSTVQIQPQGGTGDAKLEKNYKSTNDMLQTVPLILDLALVDHEIKKDAKTNETEVVIEYRGWVDSATSDPSLDALCGQKEFMTRIKRELILRKAIKEGCDIREVRTIIRDLQNQAGKDSYRTYTRIHDALDKRQKLFTVALEREPVINSLSDDRTAIDDAMPLEKYFKDKVNKKNFYGAAWWATREFVRNTGGSGLPTGLLQNDNSTLHWKTKWIEEFKMSGQSKKESKGGKVKPSLEEKKFAAVDFFFFGDLVDVLLDTIHRNPHYESDSDTGTHSNHYTKNTFDQVFKFPEPGKPIKHRVGGGEVIDDFYMHPPFMKVILPTFKWYKPIKQNGKSKFSEAIYTNLADVPISLSWFQDWFRKEIVDKQLKFYSVAAFVKALAQTIVTRILGDVCFNLESEDRVLFRTQMDIGLISEDRKEALRGRLSGKDKLAKEYHQMLKTENGGGMIDWKTGAMYYKYKKSAHRNSFPILRKNHFAMRDQYCNYFIIYPANNRSYEYQFVTQASNTLANGIPMFHYAKKLRGVQTVDGSLSRGAIGSLITDMTFTKKDAPYRREVKFFSSNMGSLAQIAGVYNVKITLSRPSYMLYPGQLIWVDAGMNDRPNQLNSTAFVLGIGGFYQIISVNHKITANSGTSIEGETIVEASWVNFGLSDNNKKYSPYKPFGRGSRPPIKSPPSCAKDIKNTNLGSLNASDINAAIKAGQQYIKSLGKGNQPNVPANPPTGNPTTTKTDTGKKEPTIPTELAEELSFLPSKSFRDANGVEWKGYGTSSLGIKWPKGTKITTLKKVSDRANKAAIGKEVINWECKKLLPAVQVAPTSIGIKENAGLAHFDFQGNLVAIYDSAGELVFLDKQYSISDLDVVLGGQ